MKIWIESGRDARTWVAPGPRSPRRRIGLCRDSGRAPSSRFRSGCRCSWRTRGNRLRGALELVLGEEVVIDAVDLSLARVAGRRRDGEGEVGDADEQLLDQRPLADPRRAGNDEDLALMRAPILPEGVGRVDYRRSSETRAGCALARSRQAADRLRRRDPALVQDPVRLDTSVLRGPRGACRRPWRSSRTRVGRGGSRGCRTARPSGPYVQFGPGGADVVRSF